ncbi:MAG: hybrid sensor histidine kinase/response regulator [Thermodesulfovibrionales bacterium]
MVIFRLTRIETWMSPLLIDLTDTLLLCIVASFLILYWVVTPMKIWEEREKTEVELKLFRNLIDQANDAIFVIDPESGRFLDINARACSSLGYGLEELLKMCVWDIETRIPDISSWKARVQNVRKEGHAVREGRHRRKDGTVFPVEVNANYISLEKRDFFVAVVRDITERKEAQEKLSTSEEAYRRIVETAGEGIWSLNDQERTSFVNTAMARMLGYSQDEIIGTPVKSYVFEEDLEDYLQRIEARHRGIGINELFEWRYRRKDGGACWCMLSATPVHDAEGRFAGSFLMCTDITKHKEMEESLRKSEEQLRHAQKMEAVGTLAGGIAHDFNNLLNVIIGYGTMVLDNLQAHSPLKGQMNEVLAAAEKAANLTRRLLVFSRKQIADVKPINVNELITDIRKMLARILRENIDFNLDLADSCLAVMADAGQIEQVLMNLATNARDAMPEGGRLTIRTGIQELDEEYVAAHGYGAPGTYACITIADTGHGMDAEIQKNIFEPFFTTKGIGEGTGLGLAISYGIVKQHGGYINVYSESGRGTVFKIYLPVIAELACPDKRTEPPGAVRGGNETILVAEDDASLRKLTRIVLESLGYIVITAEDGEDAITKFMENREKISLALIDMIMPRKNGKEVAEEIRKTSPRIKVLFLSGYTMDIIKTRELTESGFDFILKPVSSQDLLRKVREILDK